MLVREVTQYKLSLCTASIENKVFTALIIVLFLHRGVIILVENFLLLNLMIKLLSTSRTLLVSFSS